MIFQWSRFDRDAVESKYDLPEGRDDGRTWSADALGVLDEVQTSGAPSPQDKYSEKKLESTGKRKWRAHRYNGLNGRKDGLNAREAGLKVFGRMGGGECALGCAIATVRPNKVSKFVRGRVWVLSLGRGRLRLRLS